MSYDMVWMLQFVLEIQQWRYIETTLLKKFDRVYGWWWFHDMETFSTLLTLCEGNHQSPVWFPYYRASNAMLFFVSLNEVSIRQEFPAIWHTVTLTTVIDCAYISYIVYSDQCEKGSLQKDIEVKGIKLVMKSRRKSFIPR